jgi:hypothetical protein
VKKLSIKRIKRLIDEEKPRAIARYLRNFISGGKKSSAEVRLDEYANELVKKENADKSEVLERLKKIEEELEEKKL